MYKEICDLRVYYWINITESKLFETVRNSLGDRVHKIRRPVFTNREIVYWVHKHAQNKSLQCLLKSHIYISVDCQLRI